MMMGAAASTRRLPPPLLSFVMFLFFLPRSALSFTAVVVHQRPSPSPPPPMMAAWTMQRKTLQRRRRQWRHATATSSATKAASAKSTAGDDLPLTTTSTSERDDDECLRHDDENSSSKMVVIAGATGYIGRAVVRESVRLGYDTVALVRDRSFVTETEEGRRLYGEPFDGARVVQADVEDEGGLVEVLARLVAASAEGQQQRGQERGQGGGEQGGTRTKKKRRVDAVISCLASPLGTKRSARAIDYRATLNALAAARHPSVAARHFVLLSAYCVAKPKLELQRQKLRFESVLTSQTDVTYSIVRPTAFFKSVSGQLESIQNGAPYVLFGDGEVTRCNPIAEEDLAEYMLGCLDPSNGRTNRILNVGGPDGPLTNRMLGEMMYDSLDVPSRRRKFVYAPTWIFDYVINGFETVAEWTGGSERWEDMAETARIGKYYAVEDMLTTDDDEKYGSITMKMHYDKIAGYGQDPFTPVRATAVIARILESLPTVTSVSVPIGFALLNPKAMASFVAPIVKAPMVSDFSSMVLANLPHHI